MEYHIKHIHCTLSISKVFKSERKRTLNLKKKWSNSHKSGNPVNIWFLHIWRKTESECWWIFNERNTALRLQKKTVVFIAGLSGQLPKTYQMLKGHALLIHFGWDEPSPPFHKGNRGRGKGCGFGHAHWNLHALRSLKKCAYLLGLRGHHQRATELSTKNWKFGPPKLW